VNGVTSKVMLGQKPLRTRAAGFLPLVLLAVVLAGCGAATVKTIKVPKHFRLAYVDTDGNALVASVQGTDAHTLGSATQALLAPDGTLVCALVTNSDGSVSLRTYQTIHRPRPHAVKTFSGLSWSTGDIRMLAWSPDSKYVALTATRLSGGGEQPELLVVNVATGTTVTIAAGNFFGASFAPGLPDRLVYSRATVDQLDSGRAVLFTVDPNGSHTHAITTTGLDADPAWGAKGIVFASLSRLGGPTRSPRYHLWMVQPNGGALHRLTHFVAGPPAPDSAGAAISVSATGTHIVANFFSPYTTVPVVDMWTVDLERHRVVARRLTFGGSQFVGQGISSNGMSILLSPLDNGRPAAPVDVIPWQGSLSSRLLAAGVDPSWNH
jgi:hypothetical protein